MKVIEPRVEAFLRKTYQKNSRALEDLRATALKKHVPIIDRDVENFLKFTVVSHDVSRVLEIGSGVGYSALVFAQAMGKGLVVTVERHRRRYREAEANIAALKGAVDIKLLEGDAREILPALEGSFDLIFIDGGKSHYRIFFELALKRLSPGGMIVSDNVFFQGQVFPEASVPRRNRTSSRAMQEFLELVFKEPYHSVILPLGDGLLLTTLSKEER
ncbi:MAG: hypothetical protein AVO33_10885 [delta proteobacterium ML8_F1]|nr:MAG: hypothetical protein AVO33_10885 [delta proteobacterium ML8_F1]